MKHRNETYAAFTTVLRNALFLVCSLCVGAFLPSALGQLSTTGSINGTVVDPSGALIAGAKVTIVQSGYPNGHTNGLQLRREFCAERVEFGPLRGHGFAMPGFANYRETNIYLEPMAIYTVHATLKVGNDTTTVTVTGTEAAVQTTTPEISNTVSGEEAQELPLNGRNFEQLGSLMPGVINTSPVATMGTGGYSTTNSLLVNGGTTTGQPGLRRDRRNLLPGRTLDLLERRPRREHRHSESGRDRRGQSAAEQLQRPVFTHGRECRRSADQERHWQPITAEHGSSCAIPI